MSSWHSPFPSFSFLGSALPKVKPVGLLCVMAVAGVTGLLHPRQLHLLVMDLWEPPDEKYLFRGYLNTVQSWKIRFVLLILVT